MGKMWDVKLDIGELERPTFCMSMSMSMSMQSCSLSMQYVYVYNEVKNDLIRERARCVPEGLHVGAGGGEGRERLWIVVTIHASCLLTAYYLLADAWKRKKRR